MDKIKYQVKVYTNDRIVADEQCDIASLRKLLFRLKGSQTTIVVVMLEENYESESPVKKRKRSTYVPVIGKDKWQVKIPRPVNRKRKKV